MKPYYSTYDPIHRHMRYDRHDLRHDVVHYLPTIIQSGQFFWSELTRGSVVDWQNHMSRDRVEVDDTFIQVASHLLQRQIILYPVISTGTYSFKI